MFPVTIPATASKNGEVLLSISDHLEWDCENEHLLILQDKINAYLRSIESGDLLNQYPNAKGRKIRIGILAKYKPNSEAYIFIESVKEILESAGYYFQFRYLE